MRFYARENPENGFYEARLLDDNNEVLFHLQAEVNEISCWKVGFLEMSDPESAWHTEFLNLLTSVDALRDCQVVENEVPFTYLTVLCGLVKALETRSLGVREDEALRKLRKLLQENTILSFRAQRDQRHYIFGLLVQQEPFQSSFLEKESVPCILPEWWSYWLDELPADQKVILLSVYPLLAEVVTQQTRTSNPQDGASVFTLHSFGSLTKALVKFLDDDAIRRYAHFRRKLLPLLCATIVKDEHDTLEEQKAYLERILHNSNLKPADKASLLTDVVEDFQRDVREKSSLLAVIGLISQYYLEQYNLNQAASFWGLLDKKDFLLKSILYFYKVPGRYVLVTLAVVCIPLLRWLLPTASALSRLLEWLAKSTLVGMALLTLIGALVTIYRFITLKGLDFVGLLLPRLLGATVVGLSVLLLEDFAWNLGLHMNWINWVLICSVAYTFSFVYIFIDVHKTLRMLPVSGAGDTAVQPMHRSIRTSFQVFSIGLVETFLVVLFTSALTYQVVLSPQTIRQLETLRLAVLVNHGNAVSLGFFPTLVILWTGLTLFIGAFAQLLFTNQRITSS